MANSFGTTASARESARLNDGKFGTQPLHSDGSIDLGASPYAAPDRVVQRLGLDLWEPDDSAPYPQANDLEKIALVPIAVQNGATTSDAIAQALDLSSRQGAYYASAASYLRLIEADQSSGLTEFNCTELGVEIADLDTADRAIGLSEMVCRLPDAALVIDGGSAELRALLQKDGFEETTAGRRVECIEAWVAAATDPVNLTASCDRVHEQARSRFDAAAAQAAMQRREHNDRQLAAARPLTICDGCFMALPVTGACDNCA